MLHYFSGSGDGQTPSGGLLNVNGTLYGATISGGENDLGAIYAVTSSGVENVVYSFKGGSDGDHPTGKLLAINGVLYGVTNKGVGTTGCQDYYRHDFSCGTIFSVTPAGAETVLHVFHKNKDGGLPVAGLIQAREKLVGTATIGGPARCTYQKRSGCGTIYDINPDGSAFKVVYAFTGPPDGAVPQTPLLNVNGMLYGTTVLGGSSDQDTIFSLDLSAKTETVLYSFATTEGYPSSGVTAIGGTLYGETYGNGYQTYGVIYGFTP